MQEIFIWILDLKFQDGNTKFYLTQTEIKLVLFKTYNFQNVLKYLKNINVFGK